MSTIATTTSTARHAPALLFALLLLTTATALPCAAQDEADEPTTNELLNDGAWALQFQITPNFTLGSFQGSTISAKRHTSAARLSLRPRPRCAVPKRGL